LVFVFFTIDNLKEIKKFANDKREKIKGLELSLSSYELYNNLELFLVLVFFTISLGSLKKLLIFAKLLIQ
jgi:hypothetical protein